MEQVPDPFKKYFIAIIFFLGVQLNSTCEYDDECVGANSYAECNEKVKMCMCKPGFKFHFYDNIGLSCVTGL